MELLVRRLDPSEYVLLRTLRLRALADTPSAFGSTYERELAFTDEEWRRRLHPDANPHYVCGEPDAEPLGIVAVGIDRTEANAHVARVWGMWVDPAARGTGAADALIETAMAWATNNEFTVARLQVTEGNVRAERMYERLGFRRTGASVTRAHDGLVEIELERPLADG